MNLDPERFKEILVDRAETLSRPLQSSSREVDSVVVVLAVGTERCAAPASALLQVLETPPIAPLPGLPSFMPGLCQVRGCLISVVDLSRWLGRDQTCEQTFLAVADTSRGPLGLRVDGVLGLRELYTDEVLTDLNKEELQLPIRGTTKDLTMLLDLERMASREELRVCQRAGQAVRQAGKE